PDARSNGSRTFSTPSAMLDCATSDNDSSSARWQPLVTCVYNTSINSPHAEVAGSKFRSTMTPAADILFGCYLILVELLAIVFNGFVIGISIWKRKSLKASDTYVVCLAASDLGHPLTSYPMIIASSFRHSWIFGEAGCQWNGFTGFFFGVNSMMTLAVMSLSRLLVITNSNFARSHARSITLTLMLSSVAFSLFWAVCPILGWGEYGPEPYRTSCTLIWDEPDKSFVTASFVGCLAIPAAIMCYSYFRILCIALRTRHRRLQWAPRSQEIKIWEKKELRLLKMTLLMCSTFMLCWTPYAVVAMIKSYAGQLHLPPAATALPALAAKTSHVIDPLIYCGMNRNFSRHLTTLWRHRSNVDLEQTTQTMPLKNLITDV
ncbi:opsin-5-like, partial [Physella acuta]|uniref:opsin-5-like n=1 Tax=Physella acuta TaxID=109671 RepID=UPI0027DC157B